MKFVLATHNPGKLKEMADILSGLGVEVVSPADCPPSRTTPVSVWTP